MSDLFSQLGPLQRALDYHAERHNVIASNIANANTPGFKPLELLHVDSTAVGGTLALTRTEGAHLSSSESAGSYGSTIIEDTSVPPGLDGNSVSLEHEMSKLAANDLRYQGAAKIITHKLAMLRYAANDSGGG